MAIKPNNFLAAQQLLFTIYTMMFVVIFTMPIMGIIMPVVGNTMSIVGTAMREVRTTMQEVGTTMRRVRTTMREVGTTMRRVRTAMRRVGTAMSGDFSLILGVKTGMPPPGGEAAFMISNQFFTSAETGAVAILIGPSVGVGTGVSFFVLSTE